MNRFQEQDLVEVTVAIDDIYRGKVFSVQRNHVELSDGTRATRDLIKHVGGAAIVALDEDDCIYLVRQYRVAFEQVVTEIPAGKLDEAEDPLVCAKRELLEETGLTADHWSLLSTSMPSPGYIDEKIHIFLATGLHQGQARPDQGEFLQVLKKPLAEVIQAVQRGEITDAKTIIGCMLAVHLHKEL